MIDAGWAEGDGGLLQDPQARGARAGRQGPVRGVRRRGRRAPAAVRHEGLFLQRRPELHRDRARLRLREGSRKVLWM